MPRTPLLVAALMLAAPAPAALGQAVAPDEDAAPAPAPAATQPSPAPGATTAPAEPAATPVRLTRTETKRLQRRLRVRADGVSGPTTRAAIRRAERRLELVVDGRPDALLLDRLGIEPATAPAKGTPTTPTAPAGAGAKAVEAALREVGTPYEAAGDTPAGFDCSGLTQWAFEQAGVDLPHSSFQQYKLGTAVPKDRIQAGDLVFFSTAGKGPSDVGIATSPTKVVSATTRGVKEHAAFDEYWGSHYVGARRL